MARCLSLFGAQAQAMRVVGQMLPNLSVVDRQKVWVGAYEREREICMRVFGAQATRKPLHHMRILVWEQIPSSVKETTSEYHQSSIS